MRFALGKTNSLRFKFFFHKDLAGGLL